MEFNIDLETDIELAIEFMKKNSLKNKKLLINNKNYKVIDENNLITTKCKICNINFKISTKYNGNYPLCYEHRDINNK